MHDASYQLVRRFASLLMENYYKKEILMNTALHDSLKQCLRIIDCIAVQPLTYKEISEKTKLHRNTVRLLVKALIEGGFHRINIDETTKPYLISLEDESNNSRKKREKV